VPHTAVSSNQHCFLGGRSWKYTEHCIIPEIHFLPSHRKNLAEHSTQFYICKNIATANKELKICIKEDTSHDENNNLSLSENNRDHNFTCLTLQIALKMVSYRSYYSHQPLNARKAFTTLLT